MSRRQQQQETEDGWTSVQGRRWRRQGKTGRDPPKRPLQDGGEQAPRGHEERREVVGKEDRSIGRTLDLILARLEKLERGSDPNQGRRGPPKQQVHPRQQHHQQRAEPQTTTPRVLSTNADFKSLSKNLFRHVQVRHHQDNWSEALPEAIRKNIEGVVEGIRPPMIDDELKQSLRAASGRFMAEIHTLVSGHLERGRIAVLDQLKSLDPRDKELAGRTARGYVAKSFGKKLQPIMRDQLLDEALAVVGSGALLIETPAELLVAAASAIEPSPQPQRKRKQDDRSPAAAVQPPPKKKIHPDPNGKVAIAVQPETETLIIGDSNLRRMTQVPEGVQVECFPGCKYMHLKRLFTTMTTKTSLKRVIISVGINDACANHGQCSDVGQRKKALQDLSDSIRILDERASVRIYVPAVAFSSELGAAERRSIASLNRALQTEQQLLKPAQVLPAALPEPEVKSVPGQPIHYDEATANRILAIWLEHLN